MLINLNAADSMLSEVTLNNALDNQANALTYY